MKSGARFFTPKITRFLSPANNIHYRLKTPYRDGTTHVVFEPLDNIAWSDVEPPQAGPKGGGQDARSI